jgi:hypothetical protein
MLNKMKKNLNSVPKKYRHKGHKNPQGFEFDVTKFFLNYYNDLAEEKHREARKFEDLKKRWSYQYDCEIWPDL